MFVVPLIERKRDGGRLLREEWADLVLQYAAGDVPEYQMAALLMAVLLNGLDTDEVGALTDAMRASGVQLRYAPSVPVRVDKHSTGGVGDKVSLVVTPLVAAVGLAVPMVSGRGLGHTGGTLDKLESIPGFRTDLSLTEAAGQVERLGAVMLGQTEEIAPADGKLYALRDATGTVEAIPLMAASIMSKKLAEGLHGLVLDVKRGSGAFLPHLEDGLELATLMVRLGEQRECPTVALLTAMDRPLGFACGNALEVEEAITALQGEGPGDLMEVAYHVASEMVVLGGRAATTAEARTLLEQAVASGQALGRWRDLIAAQGGNPAVVDDPAALSQAPASAVFQAVRSGTIQRVEPRAIGQGIIALGGGRRRTGDRIDHSVGFVVTAKPGDRVDRGQAIGSVYAQDDAGLERGATILREAIRIGDSPPADVLPLVSHRVTASGIEILE
ncbi:MAG: thymidine phosphorylase [Gemmatimonadales bacterium]|jgi:pyrimidine-nucleoside phosphorylase